MLVFELTYANQLLPSAATLDFAMRCMLIDMVKTICNVTDLRRICTQTILPTTILFNFSVS